jgi:transcriptional regulator with XRE-family HTH domain
MLQQRFDREKILIGKRIKKIRKEKGISQLDLGVSMGMERAEISKYENGKLNLELRTIIRFAIALEVETKYLFEFDT